MRDSLWWGCRVVAVLLAFAALSWAIESVVTEWDAAPPAALPCDGGP